ncbi:von Willebrand factor type A domain-containing protein [Thermoclostridium caenicola]|uniref:von Willebrand factor type A domain-containing protein n=2 Tax=Thermoclostridium caenicola TaxID=659425 RepID=A0A1M6ITS0_9FIRM|nr:von Willebrand factor type A domain-containing protein [Thermoclostridium caenicola]
MNVFLPLTIVFAIFIAVDIITAKRFKIKRTVVRNISLVALCVLTVASGIGCGLSMARETDSTLKTLFNAYSYLLEGNIEKAAEHAEKVQDPHAEIVSMLADCWRGNYGIAFIKADDLISGGKLDDELTEQVEKIHTLTRRMTGLEGSPLSDEEVYEKLEDIAEDCFDLLKISEKDEVRFIDNFNRDKMLSSDDFYATDEKTLKRMLLDEPNDKELLRYSVKYYNAMGDLDAAEENARKLLKSDASVENIVLYTDVIAQKLMNNISLTSYDENDKEIAALLDRAEDAERAANKYDEGDPKRSEKLAKAEEYRMQANQVMAKRIINWLTARMPMFGDNSGVIMLQLSKLYSASGDEAKAREILLDLIRNQDRISDDSPIKTAMAKLGEVYHDTSASDDDIATAIGEVIKADVFLPDSVLARNYSQFLNKLLKYERVSIFISRVDADNYPTVRAYVNVNGKKDGMEELANDFDIGDFTFSDNGFEIPNGKVTRIMDDSTRYVSIALVIDGSGSMAGDRIENAKRAVEACIRNMDPETQEMSLVIYNSEAEVLVPLTNDPDKLEQGIDQINADGGTVISSGLLAGLESLGPSKGAKAIILMTDGEDNTPETIDEAIAAAQKENVAVFTVSTGGGDREYMKNIADRTGGYFMEAVTDEELANVYTTLQNYIVNNYCFEYTVEEDVASNPRMLTIGLKDYDVNSSRLYAYGGMVLTRDGSYIRRAESGMLRLLYAEPSVVSVKDAELGVPIFISASGVTDDVKVFVNGTEIKNVKTVGNSVITFTLKGKFNPGELRVTVQLADGTSKSSDKLILVAGTSGKKSTSATIVLGNSKNTIYAERVEQLDDYTLNLDGRVILNGFIRASSPVTLYSGSPITMGSGRINVSSGSISGSGAAYVDFAAYWTGDANYGQIVYGGSSVKVLDRFDFYFDEQSIGLNYYGATLTLPGFGEVYGEAEFDGSELVYTIRSGYMLTELQNNLNYALNGIPLPYNTAGNALQTITGYNPRDQYHSSYGLSVQTDEMTVVIKKDFAGVTGKGTVRGYLGLIGIEDGTLSIDTSNTNSMFTISGMAKLNYLYDPLQINRQSPITITSLGLYPDKVSLNANGFTIDADGLSACFTDNVPPKALDGSITVDYPLSISSEPYGSQVSGLLDDISLKCDKIEFVCTKDRYQNGIKAYHSSNPDKYVVIGNDCLVVPINCMDEISLFGTDLGGEITGTATIDDWWIELNLDVDGHLDNAYYGIKHDGRASFNVKLLRKASKGTVCTVELNYGGKTLTYNANAMGGISPQDGFSTYVED